MRTLASFLAVTCLVTTTLASPGDARVAKWKDDRTAAFLLMFDDGWPSHWQVAAPELAKRGLTGTFYINPSKGEFTKFAKEWEENVWRLGMAYGDHTMSHKGVHSIDEAEREIGDCAAYIRKIVPDAASNLVSYGQPGVAATNWTINAAEQNELLKKHRLIDRPEFRDHGAVYHLKAAAEMIAMADRAIASQGMEYVIFHGIERIAPDWGYQDFWAFKQTEYLALLDALQERSDRGQLWVTDHITLHRYETARQHASIRLVTASNRALQLELTCTADPRDYTVPLTVVAQVPPDWERVRIRHAAGNTLASPQAGAIRFDATPGQIELERVEP